MLMDARVTITFAEIADAAPDAAMVIDGSGLVVAANRLAHDALQLQVVGLPLPAVFRSSRATAAVAEVRASRQPAYVEAEVFGIATTVYGVHVAPLGREGHLFISFRDLTDEQRIEKMRSDFVANASHEMRTPLASIIGSIETLQGAAKNDAKARDAFLSTMLSQANRMKRLIDDLLTLSHIELNEHIRPESTVDLVDIAKQASANLASQAKQAGVDILIRAEQPVLVRGDADQLLQVAQNLIENALKYGADGGAVEVLCNSAGGKGRLQVTDRGAGIDPIHLPRLTERFYRVNTQQSRARGGTGLGLAIVKHIVARHHGRLSIASQLGQGSTFTVSVPLTQSMT
jgi:two-component system phosphate regulon sensor histidine kinase PhoR